MSFAYYGFLSNPSRFTKVNLSTFEVDDTFTTPNSYQTQSCVIDTVNGFAYFSGLSTVAGKFDYPIIIKVDLSTFTEVGYLLFEDLATYAACYPGNSVISDGFAYFVFNYGMGGKNLKKIRLSDFTEVGSLTPEVSYPMASGISSNYLLMGCDYIPGRIQKINLTTFTGEGYFSLSTGENYADSCVVSGNFGYFGTITSPGRIVKVDFTTQLRVSAITFQTGENMTGYQAGVVDGEYAYFICVGASGGGAKVVKVDLTTFTRIVSLPLLYNVDQLRRRCFVEGDYLYVTSRKTTIPYGFKIERVILSSFTLDATVLHLSDTSSDGLTNPPTCAALLLSDESPTMDELMRHGKWFHNGINKGMYLP